jgi:hypothetical protein
VSSWTNRIEALKTASPLVISGDLSPCQLLPFADDIAAWLTDGTLPETE